MKRMAIQFNEKSKILFEEVRELNEQLREEISAISYGAGIYGMYVPEEATFEEFKEDIESALMPFGFYHGTDFEYI